MPKLVFYFIQKEPGSDIFHPECFALDQDTDITIRDVIDAFPLSKFGRYHIRFRTNVGDGFQWMDPQEVDIPVPKYNGGIFLKVLNLDKVERGITRIPIEESIPTGIVSDEGDFVSMVDGGDGKDFDSAIDGGDGEDFYSTIDEENREDFDSTFDGEITHHSTPITNNDEIIEDAVYQNRSPPERKENHETQHFNEPIEEAPVELKYVTREDIQLDKSASKLTATSYEGKSETVIKAMKERENQLREKQIKALMEKKEREIAAVVHEEERDKAKQKYGPLLDSWSTDAGGEKKNIRTLLTTMHTVMWEGADFTPVQMSQLLQDSKVKLYYRKAMLKVHPDKNQDGTPEQKYIAQRIFDALNQAWNRFQEIENPPNPFMMY